MGLYAIGRGFVRVGVICTRGRDLCAWFVRVGVICAHGFVRVGVICAAANVGRSQIS